MYEWNLLDSLASASLPSAIEVSKGQGVRLQKEISYIEMFLNAVYFILNFWDVCKNISFVLKLVNCIKKKKKKQTQSHKHPVHEWQ